MSLRLLLEDLSLFCFRKRIVTIVVWNSAFCVSLCSVLPTYIKRKTIIKIIINHLRARHIMWQVNTNLITFVIVSLPLKCLLFTHRRKQLENATNLNLSCKELQSLQREIYTHSQQPYVLAVTIISISTLQLSRVWWN